MLMGFCCCSAVTCTVGTDDFVRADSNPGADWEIIDGSWTINNTWDRLDNNDTYLSRIKYTKTHPDSLASHKVTVKVRATANNDTLGIWLGGVLYVELEVATDGCGYLRLYVEDNIIAETVVEQAWREEWHELVACYHQGRLIGSFISGTSGKKFTLDRLIETGTPGLTILSLNNLWPPFGGGGGEGTTVADYVGLFTGELSGTASFDDFHYEVHKSDDYPDCNDCLECIIWEPSVRNSCAWDKVSGTWTDVTGYWLFTYGSDAKVVSRVIHSSDGPNSKLTATFRPTGFSQLSKIYGLYNTGDSDSIYVEIKTSSYTGFGYGTDGYIKLWGGADLLSEATGLTIGEYPIDIIICVEDQRAYFYIKDTISSEPWYDSVYSVIQLSGRKIAFWSEAGVGSFWVSSFLWSRSHSDYDSHCEHCKEQTCDICGPSEEDFPEYFIFELDNIEGGCSDCVDMIGSHVLNYTSQCFWSKSVHTCSNGYDLGEEGYLTLEIKLNPGNSNQFYFEAYWTQSLSKGCYTKWVSEFYPISELDCNNINELELVWDSGWYGNPDCCRAGPELRPIGLKISSG